jgi:hypothetical protein
MKPGIRVAADRSITSAPAGTGEAGLDFRDPLVLHQNRHLMDRLGRDTVDDRAGMDGQILGRNAEHRRRQGGRRDPFPHDSP